MQQLKLRQKLHGHYAYFGIRGNYAALARFDEPYPLVCAHTGMWERGAGSSEDPIGFAAGDVNLHRYVGNSVNNFVDNNGLMATLAQAPSQNRNGSEGQSNQVQSPKATTPTSNENAEPPLDVEIDMLFLHPRPVITVQGYDEKTHFFPAPTLKIYSNSGLNTDSNSFPYDIRGLFVGIDEFRGLTLGESEIIDKAFGGRLNTDSIAIGKKAYMPWIKRNTMTPAGVPWFPPRNYSDDFSKQPINSAFEPDQHHFVHEIAHVLQHRQGVPVAGKGVLATVATLGFYGKMYSYEIQDIGHKPLNEFNFEQQADIIADQYVESVLRPNGPLHQAYEKTVGDFDMRFPRKPLPPNLPINFK